ncbi:MAG: tripartite tricarboxylate transporter permease [Planctomycetota bacterium]|jgi:putative tricarboxylic transport membrane protein|nr:tripartite tricarboxylate transporter permease [Planctomycetota bacterium]
MSAFLQGFSSVMAPQVLLIMIFGVIVGIIGGALPGVSGAMTMALFLPMSYGMNPTEAISMLVAIYIGAMSGGLISAILLSIPGTPASVATTFDGAPMAAKGEAAKALGVAIVFSFLGGLFGILMLIGIAPELVRITIQFSYYEYFAVGIFSLTIISAVGKKSVLKSFIGAVIGIFFSFIGRSATSPFPRYTLGITSLNAGFAILDLMIAFYAITQIFDAAFTRDDQIEGTVLNYGRIEGFGFSMREFKSQLGNALYAACIGTGIGILPGTGGGVSCIAAYAAVRNRSKYPEKFGTGIIDGIVASETANNATVGGALIPLMTLGIPGDNATAILLAAFMVQGISPGPMLFEKNGALVYSIFAACVVCHFIFLAIECYGLRIFVKILKIERHTLLAVISAVCIVGAFTINNRLFDIWIVLIFGVLGYVLEKMDFSLVTVIIGFILGPIIEENFCRGMQRSLGDFSKFVTDSPIAVVIYLVTVLVIGMKIYQNRKRKVSGT